MNLEKNSKNEINNKMYFFYQILTKVFYRNNLEKKLNEINKKKESIFIKYLTKLFIETIGKWFSF